MTMQVRQENQRTVTKEQAEVMANVDTAEANTKRDEAAAKIAEIDELLDEIDLVLEQNAEQFVRDYVQKGGE